MLTIKEKTVSIGLGHPFSVCHITDLHLLHADNRNEGYETEHALARIPCFPHSHTVENELREYLHANRPDLLVLTGDIIDFPTESNLEALDELIRAADCPYLYVPGNHDWTFPRGYQSDEQYEKYLPLFRRWTCGTPDFQTIELGGAMWIGIDDSRRDSVTEKQRAKLESALFDCEKRNLPAVVCVHIPIRSSALEPSAKKVWSFPVMIGDEKSDLPTRNLCDLVSQKAAAVIAGHVHFEHDAPLDGSSCVQYITGLAAEGNIRLLRFE